MNTQNTFNSTKTRITRLAAFAFATMLVTGSLSVIGQTSHEVVSEMGIEKMAPLPACTMSMLNGAYATIGSGFAAPPGQTPLPFATITLMTFDGAGSVTNQVTRSNNGVISRSFDTGSYTVNPDCTGTITIITQGPPFQLTFDLVIAKLPSARHADEFYFLATTPGGVVAASGKKMR